MTSSSSELKPQEFRLHASLTLHLGQQQVCRYISGVLSSRQLYLQIKCMP